MKRRITRFLIVPLLFVFILSNVSEAAEGQAFTGIEIAFDSVEYLSYDNDMADYRQIRELYTAGVATFFVGTASELAAIADLVREGNDFAGKTVILTSDIDLEGAGLEENRIEENDTYFLQYSGTVTNAWKGIGTKENPFRGNFDGAGHRIKRMIAIDLGDETHAYAGLFGSIEGGNISNIGIDSDSCTVAYASGFANGGGIVGYSTNSRISSSYNSGVVIASSENNSKGGGIVGYCFVDTYIENCYNTGKILSSFKTTSTASYGGGIAGDSLGIIENCYNTGEIQTASSSTFLSNSYGGGIVGHNYGFEQGDIQNSYNTGAVSAALTQKATYGGAYGGGIAGYNQEVIGHCYNTGEVLSMHIPKLQTATSVYGGGVAGNNSKLVYSSYNTESITSIFSSPLNPPSYGGGIIGLQQTGEAECVDCYYDERGTITADAVDENGKISGLRDSLEGSNYQRAQVPDGLGNVTEKNVFNGAESSWYYAPLEAGAGIHPELKLVYKKENLSLGYEDGKARADLGESSFLPEIEMGSLSYQWFVGNEMMGDAENDTYTLTEKELNQLICVAVEADNYVGRMYSKREWVRQIEWMENGGEEDAVLGKTFFLEGNFITPPTEPIREGYVFGGWYQEPGSENEWNFEEDVATQNTKLYAKWKPLYDVTIQKGIGKGNVSVDKNQALEGEIIVVSPQPEEGYRLVADSVRANDVVIPLVDGQYQFTMPGQAVEVAASFEAIPKNPEIPSNENKESEKEMKPVSKPVDKPVNKPLKVPTAVKTGQSQRIIVYFLLMVLAGGAIATCFYYKKKY
ncbi:putative repeat protein (TIGR02543 family) [Aequitasia blattaphilus]|uniref:InlB B-repeat-containing protein n=1 Tax=Aequitasia blattaphilus TaxID=2949332 RepID=A0ABT1EA12_9FIRM|nr:InlB B-repeat-containing protein [Aequitasia blattaphilus]MCP1102676.1 InlB B-repeat-containing protein [Aequitasia blattaphilus]MCR8615316.1 InlB B-repeat-containing protein [Aequitasia blattaphilus]